MALLSILLWVWLAGRRFGAGLPVDGIRSGRGRSRRTVLAVIGAPALVAAVAAGIALERRRSRVTGLPGSFACRARSQLGTAGGLPPRFPHYTQRAEWRDGGLVLHGGNRFLTKRNVLGVVGPVGGRAPTLTADEVKGIDDPVAFRLRVDTGEVIDLVCAEADAPRLLEPLVLTSMRAAR
jgi:hypothetical protein